MYGGLGNMRHDALSKIKQTFLDRDSTQVKLSNLRYETVKLLHVSHKFLQTGVATALLRAGARNLECLSAYCREFPYASLSAKQYMLGYENHILRIADTKAWLDHCLQLLWDQGSNVSEARPQLCKSNHQVATEHCEDSILLER